MTAHFQLYDYGTRKNLTQTMTCDRKNVIQALISALNTGVSYEANCDTNSWRAFR
jgi:hypothetical protein